MHPIQSAAAYFCCWCYVVVGVSAAEVVAAEIAVDDVVGAQVLLLLLLVFLADAVTAAIAADLVISQAKFDPSRLEARRLHGTCGGLIRQISSPSWYAA